MKTFETKFYPLLGIFTGLASLVFIGFAFEAEKKHQAKEERDYTPITQRCIDLATNPAISSAELLKFCSDNASLFGFEFFTFIDSIQVIQYSTKKNNAPDELIPYIDPAEKPHLSMTVSHDDKQYTGLAGKWFETIEKQALIIKQHAELENEVWIDFSSKADKARIVLFETIETQHGKLLSMKLDLMLSKQAYLENELLFGENIHYIDTSTPLAILHALEKQADPNFHPITG